MEQERYTLSETGKKLGIKVRTVREWVRSGKIKAQKYPCSNRWFVTKDEINRLING